jgi:signal recognition particle receptor subunit beta
LFLISQYNAGGDKEEIVNEVDPKLLSKNGEYRQNIQNAQNQSIETQKSIQTEVNKLQGEIDKYSTSWNESQETRTQHATQVIEISQKLKELQASLEKELTIQKWLKTEADELKDYPRADFQQTPKWDKGIQICVTGSGRAGKSTFINTMRDIRDETTLINSGRKIAFAKVQAGEETTLVATKYKHDRDLEHEVSYWDLPGYGTPLHPQDGYLRTMGLKYFDLVILMTFDVFKDGDLQIMTELKNNDIPFVMVRNKVDETLQFYFQDEDLLTDEQSINKCIREIYKKIDKKEELDENQTQMHEKYIEKLNSLRTANPGTEHLYFISAFHQNQDIYETLELAKKIKKLVGENVLKRQKKDQELMNMTGTAKPPIPDTQNTKANGKDQFTEMHQAEIRKRSMSYKTLQEEKFKQKAIEVQHIDPKNFVVNKRKTKKPMQSKEQDKPELVLISGETTRPVLIDDQNELPGSDHEYHQKKIKCIPGCLSFWLCWQYR